jgi:sigma-E factor negative regulatory protein RseC
MLTEQGRVVALEADGLWVETVRASTCGKCSAASGCGHGLLNRLGDGRRNYVRVLPGDQPLSAIAVGDEVRIAVPEEVFLRGSLLVYGLPLLGLLGGALALPAALSDAVAANEPLAVAGAVTGFALGAGLVRWHAWRHRDDRRLQPILLGHARAGGSAAQAVTVS